MTRGFDQHQQRLQALSALGKDLARRARSKCELCGATGNTSGGALRPREIEPVPPDPDLDHCLLACQKCHQELDRKGAPDGHHWRCLETSAWSELPAVQVTAVRTLRKMQDDWASALLDQLYLWPDAEKWLEQG